MFLPAPWSPESPPRRSRRSTRALLLIRGATFEDVRDLSADGGAHILVADRAQSGRRLQEGLEEAPAQLQGNGIGDRKPSTALVFEPRQDLPEQPRDTRKPGL